MHTLSRDILKKNKELLLHQIETGHLHSLNNSDGAVFYISGAYPGVWLEHCYDGVALADYDPQYMAIAENQVRLFLKNQKPSGQLPCYVWQDRIGYGWTQECVSFGLVCLQLIRKKPEDKRLLEDCYRGVTAWIDWLYRTHMPHKTGLVEMFCGFDTGHDNSGRLNGMKYREALSFADGELVPQDDPVLPALAPDMNAVFYGNLRAAMAMAERLSRWEEAAAWNAKAEAVRKKLFDYCYDPEDLFFYDVDKNGKQRKIRSISITNVFCEGVVDYDLGNEIFERHLHNPREFWTPYPFPAIAVNDACWVQNSDGNSWSFYSQGLTALRTLLWMEHYGRTKELEEMMSRWVEAWTNSTGTQFGQELHPITGKPSACSQFYSSCMLYYLHAIKRLYDI